LKVAVLFSGGKDSTYTVYWALEKGYEVACLLTMISENPESYMFHTVNIEWTRLQAKAMEIPHLVGYTKGVKELEIRDLSRLINTAVVEYEIEGIVSGAITSQYQKSRVERVAEENGVLSIAPLWRKDPVQLLKEYLDLGFEILITGVFAMGLGGEWLGVILDHEYLDRLVELSRRYQISPVGEGGEFETFVLDAPHFVKRIEIVEYKRYWYGDWGILSIEKAKLTEKI